MSTAMKKTVKEAKKGPYTCGQCDQTFTLSTSLTRHQHRAHSKQHMCFLCDQDNGMTIFGVKIKEHLETVHNVSKMVSCVCCQGIFGDKSQLTMHKKAMEATGRPGNEVFLAKSQAFATVASEPVPSPEVQTRKRTRNDNETDKENVPKRRKTAVRTQREIPESERAERAEMLMLRIYNEVINRPIEEPEYWPTVKCNLGADFNKPPLILRR
ncbi:unnamed protein product [Caenorhabditis sp. 36 PRJEB53466]|nr:unnamed protein product [Caenorhabditis sp. 36 PRJEB53466]